MLEYERLDSLESEGGSPRRLNLHEAISLAHCCGTTATRVQTKSKVR